MPFPLHREETAINLILAEVLQGFRDHLEFHRARRWLSRLAYADLAGREVALQAATNYRILRCQGVTVRKTVDMLIATFCIRNGHSLLYTDRDFDPMADGTTVATARIPIKLMVSATAAGS